MEWNQEMQYKRSFGPGSLSPTLNAEHELIEGFEQGFAVLFYHNIPLQFI